MAHRLIRGTNGLHHVVIKRRKVPARRLCGVRDLGTDVPVVVVISSQHTKVVGVGKSLVGEDVFKCFLKARVMVVFHSVEIKVVAEREGVFRINLACQGALRTTSTASASETSIIKAYISITRDFATPFSPGVQ